MKKSLTVFTIALAVMVFVLAAFPTQKASAIQPPQKFPLASGDWTEGDPIAVDLVANPAPAWLQLAADGTKLDGGGELCHPFRGGQFYWVAEIRQLVDGKWVKLATTVDWVPSKEGKLTACATAPAAGVYALFAWFDPPDGYIEPKQVLFN